MARPTADDDWLPEDLLTTDWLTNEDVPEKEALIQSWKLDKEENESHLYVQNVDEWDIDQGRSLASESGHHRVGGVYDLSRPLNEAMADFYHTAFNSEPEVVEGCHDQLREQFIKTLLESSDFRVLHESTQWNHIESQIAAKEFAYQFAQYVKEKMKEQEESIDKTGKSAPGYSGLDIPALQTTQAAIATAEKEIEALQEMQRAFGAGNENGKGSTRDMESVYNIFLQTKNNATLRAILERTGKYRRTAQSRQRLKTQHGFDDMVGVELAGDVGRLLPLELAKLADPDFELDAMRRLVERQSMCRSYQGMEPKGKGPIVVCIDESKSMLTNNKIDEAKAFALAMAWIALHQNRSASLFAFEAGTKHRRIDLLPGKWSQLELLNWLKEFLNGGTTCHIPLVEVPRQWESKRPFSHLVKTPLNEDIRGIRTSPGKADMIIVTDGILPVPVDIEQAFNEWKKKEQVKVTTIIIGETQPGDLERVSDELYLVNNFSVNCEAVDKCFSI